MIMRAAQASVARPRSYLGVGQLHMRDDGFDRRAPLLAVLFLAHGALNGFAEEPRVPRFEAAACPFEHGDWAPGPRLHCGYLVVPEQREGSRGQTIRLAVAVLRARDPNGEPALVRFGASGSALRNTFGRLIEERLDPEHVLPEARNRDIVVYDERGTGLSEPSLCPKFGSGFLPVESDTRSIAVRERLRWEIRRCVTELKAQKIDRAAYNPVAGAADLADLRHVLGYASWDVYAGSQGSRVALEAMRRHPEGIRSVVLQDPWPPGPTLAERPLWAQRALERVFATCRGDTECRLAFPTVEEDFYALYDQLERTPVSVDTGSESTVDGLALDGGGLVTLLERSLRFGDGLPWIPLELHQLRHGDRTRALRELVRRSRGVETQTRVAWYLASCYDQFGPAFEARMKVVGAIVAPPFRDRMLDNCDLWQERFGDGSQHAAVHSDIPTLILTGELSIEPAVFGRRLAATLARAYLYEFPGIPHGARPTGCAAMILAQFLADPTRTPDASCVANMPRMRFMLRWPEEDSSATPRLPP